MLERATALDLLSITHDNKDIASRAETGGRAVPCQGRNLDFGERRERDAQFDACDAGAEGGGH